MITKKDLIKDIKFIPIEIVKAMIQNQVLQGNPADVTVFQNNICSQKDEGGFDWNKTKQKKLWMDIVYENKFDSFFKEYKNFYIRGDFNRSDEIRELFKELGMTDYRCFTFSDPEMLYFINPLLENCISRYSNSSVRAFFMKQLYYEYILPEKEIVLTMDEIASKFGINVTQLKIKK